MGITDCSLCLRGQHEICNGTGWDWEGEPVVCDCWSWNHQPWLTDEDALLWHDGEPPRGVVEP
jgi:hypothetical protein